MYKIKNKMSDRRKLRLDNRDVILEPFEVKVIPTPIPTELMNVFEYVEDESVEFDDLKITTEPLTDVVVKTKQKRGN